METNKYDIYLFKVQDYTTVILGRFDESKGCYYVQRGDGTKYEYEEYRITWKQQLFSPLPIEAKDGDIHDIAQRNAIVATEKHKSEVNDGLNTEDKIREILSKVQIGFKPSAKNNPEFLEAYERIHGSEQMNKVKNSITIDEAIKQIAIFLESSKEKEVAELKAENERLISEFERKQSLYIKSDKHYKIISEQESQIQQLTEALERIRNHSKQHRPTETGHGIILAITNEILNSNK